MNCKPESDICSGDQVIFCECPCDNCEGHLMECQGCVNCDSDAADHNHRWVEGLDPRWLICAIHPDEAMVKAA